MAKLGKDKIALFLACASVLGGKTQAMNKPQSQETVAAVGEAADKSKTKKIDWNKILKIGGFAVAGLAALEIIRNFIGGFTDSKVGSYSIGRAIRNFLNKNNQLVPEDKLFGDGKLNISNISNISLHEDNNQNDQEELKKNISLIGGNGGKLDEQTATSLEKIDYDFEKCE